MTTNEIYIDVLDGELVLCKCHRTFSVDKDDFASMVKLAEFLNDLLFELEVQYENEHLKHGLSMELKVFSEHDTLFMNMEAYKEYTSTHRIESRLRNDWSLNTYVNDILFYGDIEEGMIVK